MLSLSQPSSWRILRLYNSYRVIIGALLVLLASSHFDKDLLPLAYPGLFRASCWIYLSVNLLLAFFARQAQQPAQIFSLALIDIILLSVLFYSAGGTHSGIGTLFLVSVSISNILLRGRIGLLIAALAAIGLIYLTFYLSLDWPEANNQFVQAGALGALCFAAALFIQALTRRIQDSEVLVERHAATVADLEALNSLILQRMRTGILLLDQRNRVLVANQATQTLLGREIRSGESIEPISPDLLQRFQQWKENPTRRPDSLHPVNEGPVLQPSFALLQRGRVEHTLIFLDDISQVAQHAQQLKLASLGRLTAGIAHEIRNPLGAISHAAQLLQESEALDQHDKRLAQIIQDHSRRMNTVIENVLQLSRRRQAEPQLLDLKYWLHRFASEFRLSAASHQTLHIETSSGTLQTRMDPHQLNQVLTNLVENGMRYSAQLHPQAQVWLRLYRDADSDLPVAEVLDDGPGIATEHANEVFEPFYTTDSKGTGLGLYISRELCESNQARLDYRPREGGGSCFRITFAHPRKLS